MRSVFWYFALATGASLVMGLSPRRACAQSDKAGAEALMSDGVKLAAAQHYAEACPKFQESLRLYASLNTEYFLADCLEHLGKMASAWVEYLEVAEKSRTAGEAAKENKARERAHRIEAKVSHLTIQVSEGGAGGLRIERDGVEVGGAQWGVAMPVDPGEHIVVASAPGHAPATLRTIVKGDGDQAKVMLPALQASQLPAPATPWTAPNATRAEPSFSTFSRTPEPHADAGVPATGNGRRTSELVLAGVGIVTVGVGGVLGLMAKSAYDSAPGCSGTVCQDQAGLDARNAARSTGNVATVVVLVGAALAVGGSVLWIIAPKGTTERSAVSDLQLGIAFGGAALAGRF